MISRGINTLRFPKNALLSSDHRVTKRLAFIDGESYGSTFAGESIASRGATWRTLLANSRIPVSQWRVFRANEPKSLIRYVDEIGYPARLRSVKEDNPDGRFIKVSNQRELHEAATGIRQKYPRIRMLAQADAPDQSLNVLVLGGKAISAVVSDSKDESYEVSSDTHPDMLALAEDALRACVGLEDGSVILRINSYKLALAHQDAIVDAISPKPMLRLRECARYGHGVHPSGVVEKFLQFQAKRQEILLPPRSDSHYIQLAVSFIGAVDDQRFMHGLADEVVKLGIQQVTPKPREAAVSQIFLTGSPIALALLVSQSVAGFDNGEYAHCVETSYN